MNEDDVLKSLIGRTIEGVGVDDGDFFLELDDERTIWVWSDDDESLNLSIAGNKTN